MRFAPKPENDFAQFIHTYYEDCRARCPKIEAIGGKWTFRDLIPGMSDFDTRLIVADDMTVDDWCAMSMAVHDTHTFLCRRHPSWARNLEHLPGINLTWAELKSERAYYPEYNQWSFYDTERPDKLHEVRRLLDERPWDTKDELFHLKKFCLYYGRYNRTIDPPVNLGVHENKYPLHSRVMHYFCPPVQSAVCLLNRYHLAGKFEAFEWAAARFPELPCWDMIFDILHDNYEAPEWYEEPRLVELEDALEEALTFLMDPVRERATLIPPDAGADVAVWKRALAEVPVDPAMTIFDSARFSRLMKGRLLFYANAPIHFDSEWLIRNELGRIGTSFFRLPFQTFWRIRTGETVEDPVDILDRLRGEVLDDEEVGCTREFARLTAQQADPGTEKQTARQIAAVFDGFLSALTKVGRVVAGGES